MTTPAAAEAPAAEAPRAGSIYDIGYRRYEGPRLGRGHAIRTLVLDSFRTTFGIGHGGRAKIAPIVLAALAVLPAIIVVGFLSLAAKLGAQGELENASPLGYDTYYRQISAIIALFCAVQAPELFGRDQRHGVLALYFARALHRTDYAIARLTGFGLAVLSVLLLPMVILLIGRVLLATDIAAAFGRDYPKLPAVVGQALIIAGLYGSLAMAISAFTPRRAYATAGTIAVFVVPGLIAEIVIGLDAGPIGTWLALLAPATVLDGTTALLFGKPLPQQLFFFDLPLWTFLVSALAATTSAAVVVVRRFARIAA
jgi:ABC-2 type transport system permease protein